MVNLNSGGRVTDTCAAGGDGRIYGGATNTGNVSNSAVNVNGDIATRAIGGGFVRNRGNATGNQVTVNSGTIDERGTVVGGSAFPKRQGKRRPRWIAASLRLALLTRTLIRSFNF